MIAKRLREFNPLFMEEPVHPENLQGLKKYRTETDVRVALGERILTKEQVIEVLANNLTDFLQPDITNIGGVTQARKIAAIAESYGVEVAFHNAFGPIQNAVTIQVDASIPNFLIQESFYDVFPAWKRQLIKDQSSVEDGYATVPTKPGLGVEVDEKNPRRAQGRGTREFQP
jgi:L-alanine-DL-glutamate epimerase-like enolase superfamily enzyme